MMRGLAYRAAMSAVAIVALILIFWQFGLFETHPFAAQKLVLLCACVACTLLLVPFVTRNLAVPALIGISAVTVLFDVACIIIACLRNDIFLGPVVIAAAIYILLLLSFLFIQPKSREKKGEI